jgi:hypothetical protein
MTLRLVGAASRGQRGNSPFRPLENLNRWRAAGTQGNNGITFTVPPGDLVCGEGLYGGQPARSVQPSSLACPARYRVLIWCPQLVRPDAGLMYWSPVPSTTMLPSSKLGPHPGSEGTNER